MSETIETKTCTRCKQTKPITEFYRDRSRKDGHHLYCKDCQKEYAKQYSQTENGKAVHRKATFRYRKTEKCKAYHKRYSQSEKFKAQQKAYLQSANGRKLRQASRKRSYSRHPEKDKARVAVNVAIKHGQLPRADSLQCHYCPEQAKQYHHHKGYEPEHLLDVIPVCVKCHSRVKNSSSI